MRKKQGPCGRGFVDLTGFDAHNAVFNHIRASHAVLTRDGVQFFQQGNKVHFFTVQRHRYAFFESDFDIFRLIGCLFDLPGDHVGILRRFVPQIFQRAAFNGDTPDILIDTVDLFLAEFDGEVLFDRIIDLGLPGSQLPITQGSYDLEGGIKHFHTQIKADLVIAFCGTPVSHDVHTFLMSDIDEVFRDQRASVGGGKKIFVLIDRVGLQSADKVFFGKFFAQVHDIYFGCAGRFPAFDQIFGGKFTAKIG